MADDEEFLCERYVNLSDTDRQNLILLKIFRSFEWMKSKQILNSEQSFGEISLNDGAIKRHKETMVTGRTKVCLMMLERMKFMKIINRINSEAANQRIKYIQSHWAFSDLSYR